jgi:hypothetical protein
MMKRVQHKQLILHLYRADWVFEKVMGALWGGKVGATVESGARNFTD